MELEIDRIFDQAYQVISSYCDDDESPEECLLRHFPKKEINEPTIFEFRIRPFEVPIYVICCLGEYSVHLIVATKKDAINTGNFVMIDEIDSFRKRQASHN